MFESLINAHRLCVYNLNALYKKTDCTKHNLNCFIAYINASNQVIIY